MTSTIPLPSELALSHTLCLAQAQAERQYGSSPTVHWQPTAVIAVPARRLGWTLAIGTVAAAGVGWLATRTDDATLLPAPIPVAVQPATTPADERVSTLRLVTRPAPPEPSVPASATLEIARQRGTWSVRAQGANRLLAAQRLASASGSQLTGDLSALANGRALNVNWRGGSIAAAWQTVLGTDVSFASQCDRLRCRVWIVDGSAIGGAGAAPFAPTSTTPSATLASASLPQTPALDSSSPTAPDVADSADPRVAAHHD